MPTNSIDKTLDYLTKLEQKEAALKEEYSEKLRAVQTAASRIRLLLTQQMQANKVSNIKLASGYKLGTYTKRTVNITEPDVFFRYILHTGAIELLHRRINQREALALADADKAVPGTAITSEVKLRITHPK